MWAEWWGWNTRGQAGPTSRGGRGWAAAAAAERGVGWGWSCPTPYTLHPTPYTIHPTPYILHPTSYTLKKARTRNSQTRNSPDPPRGFGGAARYPSTLHACCTSLPPSLGIKWGVWAEWWGWNTRGQAGPTSRGGRGWVAAAALADVLALLDPTSMYAGCKRHLLVQGSHG